MPHRMSNAYTRAEIKAHDSIIVIKVISTKVKTFQLILSLILKFIKVHSSLLHQKKNSFRFYFSEYISILCSFVHFLFTFPFILSRLIFGSRILFHPQIGVWEIVVLSKLHRIGLRWVRTVCARTCKSSSIEL